MLAENDFFISYTGEDVEWAHWIAWELERAGYTTTYQAKDFAPGSAFMHEMRKASNQCKKTIAILSPAYLSSRYSAMELNAALVADPSGDERKLLPIRVKPCTADAIIKDRVYIDLVGVTAKSAARRALLQGVRANAVTRKKRGAPSRPIFPPETGRRSTARSVDTANTPLLEASYPLKVLFLASEAKTGLDLRGQFAAIRRGIKSSRQPNAIRFNAVFDITTSTIFDALNRYSPHVVHFSGKQDGGDMLIRTDDGNVTTLTDVEFAGMIRSLEASVRLVIIDTCYSLRAASSIAQIVEFAIGVKSFIYEDKATAFYSTFYQAIAAGRSVQNATEQARARLRMMKVPAAQIPELRMRRGATPSAALVRSSRVTT